MSTIFELANLPSTYAGNLTNLNLSSRWDVNASQTGKLMLNPASGPLHDSSVQSFKTDIKNFTQTGAQSGVKILNTVFISPKIVSGSITGTYLGQIQAQKANTSGDFTHYGYLTVMDINGNYKGKIAEFAGNLGYVVNTYTNRSILSSSVNSGYVFASGDRLVLEIGTKVNNNLTGNHKFVQKFGHATSGELPVNQTDTSVKNPWLQISENLTFI